MDSINEKLAQLSEKMNDEAELSPEQIAEQKKEYAMLIASMLDEFGLTLEECAQALELTDDEMKAIVAGEVDDFELEHLQVMLFAILSGAEMVEGEEDESEEESIDDCACEHE